MAVGDEVATLPSVAGKWIAKAPPVESIPLHDDEADAGSLADPDGFEADSASENADAAHDAERSGDELGTAARPTAGATEWTAPKPGLPVLPGLPSLHSSARRAAAGAAPRTPAERPRRVPPPNTCCSSRGSPGRCEPESGVVKPTDQGTTASGTATGSRFAPEDTLLIFDWDDTVLPSTWVQGQGLRLDESSELSPLQRSQLAEVANVAAETLRLAKQHGTVVLVTNAERGWIELSCQKFLPTLLPVLENIKVLSARTAYETPQLVSPADWKLRAFASEIERIYGSNGLAAVTRRKNVVSLGDSVHEREALQRATAPLLNCRSKSLKFVERPDIAQICKQHALVVDCFDNIIQHDGNLDLCIRCP